MHVLPMLGALNRLGLTAASEARLLQLMQIC
jgi:hypothetical protein